MMASVTAPGVTTINNAAKDPEIEDLANFLNACGADISGAGSQWIEIRGVPLERMHGTSYRVVPDRIEAGTFLIAGVATRGKVRTNNVVPKHLSSLSAKLLEMGAGVETGDDWIEVSYRGELRATDISTVWYPGFPTDLQPQFSSLATLAHGVSVIKENIYEDRFAHIQELTGMGANARQPSHDLAIIEGVETLTGSQVSGNDLRATAGLIIAGMMAQGGSEVYGLSHLDRGYADFAGKLRSLGANVTRCP
jgi:UDP-N-acetylglucosamine 1-carboxyvinyltransferase